MWSRAWRPAAAACFAGRVAHCHGASSGHGDPLPAKWHHSHGDGKGHVLFAIPKKGRLHEKIKEMLHGAGIEYSRAARVDIAHCTNLPLSLVFLPAADIATYVGEGEVDIGITGEDIICESDVEVITLMKLGFGKCRLCVQAPKGQFSSPAELAGKRIVTSFPHLAEQYFAELESGKKTQIKRISGSVEASCGLGLADGIVDLVETGTTMHAAGLEDVATVMATETVLIANPHSINHELVETVRKRIAGFLTASSYVMVAYNVRQRDLDKVIAITPGKRSPTIAALDAAHGSGNEQWVAVQALVPKKLAAMVMDELEHAGATDILQTALLSCRMGD